MTNTYINNFISLSELFAIIPNVLKFIYTMKKGIYIYTNKKYYAKAKNTNLMIPKFNNTNTKFYKGRNAKSKDLN